MEKVSGVSIYDGFPPLSSKYPWLVAHILEDEEHRYQDQFFYSIHDQLPNYRCRIPELQGKRIRGFFHGWLILSNHLNNKWTLWNQATSKIVSLPTLILKDGDYESIGECCLSLNPNNQRSILLLTRTNKSTFVFFRLGSRSKKFRWTEMSYAYQLKRLTSNGKLVHSLTCCDGHVYCLSSDGYYAKFVIHIFIVVKDTEVVITLLLFGLCPFTSSGRGGTMIPYLKGINKELFYIGIYFETYTNKTPTDVFLHKLDMNCVNWVEREFCLKNWNLADIKFDDLEEDDIEILKTTQETWDEIYDLKDTIFFIDIARDHSISYRRGIASELGGYIHIRGETGEKIYSYHVKDDTISLSTIPSPILPTSHLSMWECRSQDDDGEAKSIIDSKAVKQNGDDVLLRSGTDNVVQYSESHLLNIPFNVLEKIMEFCAGVGYMKFRGTCKQCNLAGPLIKWNSETSLKRLQSYSPVSPWLMAVDRRQGIISFTDPILGDKYLLRNSQLPTFYQKIFSSRFGWLLCESNDCTYNFFYNPFTNDIRRLPELELQYGFKSSCFSAPPTSPDCIVVGFSTQRDWIVHILFVNQEPTWRSFLLGQDPHKFCFSSFYGRDLYALCQGGELIVISNLGDEDYSWKIIEAEPPRGCCRFSPKYFLTNCDQHLLLVSVGEYGETIELFKRDYSKHKWKKVNTVGKNMIYVCGTTCYCIEAKSPKMENKIFFPRLHTKNGKVVFYALDTCTYHTFDGANVQEHLVDFVGTTYHVSPHMWIEPNWS